MKTLIRLVIFSLLLLGTALGNTQLGTPSTKTAQPMTEKPPLTAEQCLQQATPALKKRDVVAYHRLLKQAAGQHSGLAALELAEQTMANEATTGVSPAMHPTVTNELLTAAQYGYPHRAYQDLARLAQSAPPGQASSLLVHCDENLARRVPNAALVTLCASRLGSDFHQVVNVGRQTPFEHQRYVRLAIQRFCQQDDATVLSTDFSAQEVVSLRHAFCHGHSVDDTLKKNGLQNGDRVVTASGIKVWQDAHLMVDRAPLEKNDIVYRINPPITPFLFDGKTLSEANEGTVVMRNHRLYRVVHHHLQPAQHP